MVVQSVLFRISTYSLADCLEWLRSHNYTYNKLDVAKHFYRFRQVSPMKLKKEGCNNYRTIDINDGNILLVEAY